MPQEVARLGSVLSREPIMLSCETHDFDQMAEMFMRWNHRFEQLGLGKFHGRLRLADFNGVQLFDVESSLEILSRGVPPHDFHVFSPVEPSNAGAAWRGRTLRPGTINVLSPGDEINHRTCRDYRQTGISIRSDLLEAASTTLTGLDLDVLLRGNQSLDVDPTLVERLVGRLRVALEALLNPDEAHRQRHLGPIDPRELVADLVGTLARGRIIDPVRTTPGQRIQVVREAEAFARSHPPEHVTILKLCEVTHVSERTLHYAFLEVTGLPPKDYLKTVRLNQARRELRAFGPKRGCVQEVARRHGFNRPGNFAADFQRLFGELPSETPGVHRS